MCCQGCAQTWSHWCIHIYGRKWKRAGKNSIFWPFIKNCYVFPKGPFCVLSYLWTTLMNTSRASWGYRCRTQQTDPQSSLKKHGEALGHQEDIVKTFGPTYLELCSSTLLSGVDTSDPQSIQLQLAPQYNNKHVSESRNTAPNSPSAWGWQYPRTHAHTAGEKAHTPLLSQSWSKSHIKKK